MFKEFIRSVINSILDNLPAFCQRCGRVVREKNLKDASSVLGFQVRICQECHQELYQPWSAGGSN